MLRRVFIVGNGPIKNDISDVVDASDFVLRFNEPKVSIGMTGVKTDLLYVNNADKPMQRRLANPDYWTSPIVSACDKVVFVYDRRAIKKYVRKPNWTRRLRGRRAAWTEDAFEAYSAIGKYVRVLSLEEYEEGYFELGLKPEDAKHKFPSTGYFGIRHVLKNEVDDNTEVNICGFSFEGWKKHSWSEERHWLESQRVKFKFSIW